MQEDDGYDRITRIMHIIFWSLFVATLIGTVWAYFHFKNFF